MRKRQWKKILSVVLALAMVFSMNVSAFADEVTDPVAVEEPAAEQPAEAPAAEEPAAEEPAPAEEEAPPAEAPAPAEAEEPAGGDTTLEILGWTFGFDDSNPEEAPSYEGAFVTVSYAGTTITDATNPQDITLSSNGTGTAAITITGGNNKFYVIKEDDSFVEANGFSLTSSMTAGVDLKKVADQPDAPVATTNYTIDKSAADKWTVKAVNASQRLEYLVATSSTGTYADLDNSTGADITATDKAAGKKMFVRVKAIYDETEDTGSVITTPASVAAEIDYTPAPTPEGSFTVSGFTFEIDDTTTVSDISYTGGIGEVTFSAKEGKKASVTMKKTGSADPVSVNLATADVTVVADDSITGDMPVSFKGTGLVKFTKKGTFESVASGLTLSGNDVDVLAINVDSEGAATKYTLITKEEAGKKVDEGAVRIAIASKDTGSWSYSTSDEAFTPASASYTLSVDTLDLVPFATKLVASEDAIKGVSVEYSTEEKKNVIILATDSDISTATFTYITVPVQGKYNIENALNSGVATAGGVDLTQWIYNKDKKYDNISKYEFIISSNETLDQYTTRTGTGWNTWVTGTTIKKVVNNAGVEAGKTYYLIARKKATGSEFASVAQVVGSFVPLKDTSISINLARTLSPNYTGDVWNLDSEDAAKFLSSQNTNAVNLSMFSFTYNYPTGLSVVDERKYAYQYELDEEDNVFRVNDSDGNKVGDLTLHFYKDYSAGKFSNEQDVAYYALTPGLWGVSVSFAPYSEASQVYGAQADSNTISFNVVKAPVKYVPKVTPNPSVSGSLVSPDYEATNIVTGAPVNTGITYFTGSESYLINSKVSTSFNGELPAGTYKVAVSAGDLASSYYAVSKENDEDKTGRYYTDYSTEIDWTVIDNKATNLVVTGAQKSADDRGTVYYGANLAAVEGAVETKATLAGTEVTLTNKDNFIVLSAVSNDLVHAKALTDAEMAKISANQTVYAYYKTCEFQSLTVSSAAIPVTISKRPIDIIYDADGNGTADTLKTVRGADLISTVSASKLVGTINEIEMDFHGTESKTLKGSVLIDTTKGPDVKLDTSMLDKNIPTDGTEAVPLTGYSLSSNLLENFTTGSDTVDYLIEARYYVQYILEYSGTDGSIKKKYVSTNVIDKDNLDNPVTYGSWITIDPATTLGEKMALSWGGILPAGDEITGWKVTRSDYTNVDEISTYNGTTDVYATEYDYLVYAVVTAAATKEGVMVKSIAPVAYSMRAHVEQGSSKKNVSRDLDVVLYDKNKTVKLNKGDSKYGCFFDDDWYINPNCVLIEKDTTAAKAWVKVCPKLVYGQDYTITVKNNKNASVAYDPSVSNNNGEDGTFKQLFAEKKRPQVVVKGKGDYKKLNTTILFDILPRNIRPAVNDEISITGIDEFYLAGKTLQI